jgi:hypothetical protein
MSIFIEKGISNFISIYNKKLFENVDLKIKLGVSLVDNKTDDK